MKSVQLIKKTAAALVIAAAALAGCTKAEEKGETAAAEFCECFAEKSLSECEKELNSKYGAYDTNDDFISAFNAASTCGVTISKK
jgi:hypothetical protein